MLSSHDFNHMLRKNIFVVKKFVFPHFISPPPLIPLHTYRSPSPIYIGTFSFSSYKAISENVHPPLKGLNLYSFGVNKPFSVDFQRCVLVIPFYVFIPNS